VIHSHSLGVLAVSLLTTGLAAQSFIPVPAGSTPVALTAPSTLYPAIDEGISGALPLGFMFPSPAGGMWSSIEVTSNGRIFEAGVGSLAGAPSFVVFDADFAAFEQLAPCWDDLDNAANIFFDTTSVPGTAVVTWQDVTLFGDPSPFTFQAQLASTGQITYVYDDRHAAPFINSFVRIVGVSDGSVTVPAELNFSDVASLGLLMGTGVSFEQFDAGLEPFDIGPLAPAVEAGLDFVPSGPGMWTILGNVPLSVLAEAVPGRAACTPAGQFDLTLIPTAPGYVLSPGGTFDAGFGAGVDLGLTDESESTPQTLSFPFTMPGGTSVTSIIATSNGRVIDGASTEFSDFSPTVAEFLSDATPAIAALWSDFDPGTGGRVVFHDDGTGTSASVTWDSVPEWLENNSNTVQVQMFPGGLIQLNYQRVEPAASVNNLILGVSPGNGAADPEGESDFSTLNAVSADDVLYEFFDTATDTFDLTVTPVNANLTIEQVSPPLIGTNFEVDVLDANGTAVAAAYFFGFPTGLLVPSINLGVLGAELANCEMLTDIVTPGAVVSAPVGTPGTPTTIFPIPNSPALIGVSGLVVSALVIDGTVTPAIRPTDELVVTIGNL
jgi:hypothetical protein